MPLKLRKCCFPTRRMLTLETTTGNTFMCRRCFEPRCYHPQQTYSRSSGFIPHALSHHAFLTLSQRRDSTLLCCHPISRRNRHPAALLSSRRQRARWPAVSCRSFPACARPVFFLHRSFVFYLYYSMVPLDFSPAPSSGNKLLSQWLTHAAIT
jgi:hypothetical protein